MKNLYGIIWVTLLLIVSGLSIDGYADVTQKTRFKIVKLSSPTIKIGTKILKQGDTFGAGDVIHWSRDDQSMLACNVATSELVRFSKRLSEKKGKVKSLLDLYMLTNMGSTRGTYDHISLEKSENGARFPERRIALVVGNQNYEYLAPLKNAQKDAEDISATLLDLGFDVIELYETTYPELMAGVNKFSGLAQNYDVALFYYAGHGIQEDNINYLVPVDNMLDRQADLRDCVSCNEIVDKVEKSNCPSKIFYFDACRDRKTSWSRSVLNGLSAMEGDAGTVIVFATQSGKVAADGDRDGNSPFAKMLIKNMRAPQLSFPEMMTSLVKDTYAATGQRQYPVKVGDLISDFRFNPSDHGRNGGRVAGSPRNEVSNPVVKGMFGDGYDSYRTENFRKAIKYRSAGQYELAMQTFLKEPDNPKCQQNIAFMYLYGEGVEKDMDKAKEWFDKIIAKGFGIGFRGMGECFKEGKDYVRAMEWYKKGFENGDADCACNVGLMFEQGLGVRQDYGKAAEWYQKGVDNSDVSSMGGLASLYYRGEGIPKDEEKARELINKAEKVANDNDCFFLGYCYDNGFIVGQDYNKAYEYYMRSADADNENAMYSLAMLYLNGNGVREDYEAAYEWFRKAADLGLAQAMYMIGAMYHSGEFYLAQDFGRAMEWYRKAAAKGDSDAMYWLGKMYYYGQSVSVDYAKAKEWYSEASGIGHVEATVKLANMYFDGMGVDVDLTKALELYRKAASGGNDEAMLNIGVFYEVGLAGLSQDIPGAAEWYGKAADGGNAQAMFNLARLYEDYNNYGEKGVTKDPKKAIILYEKAVEQGHAEAMRNLGIKYYYGEIVKMDKARAKELLQKSANAGSADSKSLLEKLSFE